jgi:hypothetical protein
MIKKAINNPIPFPFVAIYSIYLSKAKVGKQRAFYTNRQEIFI